MPVSSQGSLEHNPLRDIGVKGSDIYTETGVGDPRVALSVQLVRGADPTAIAREMCKCMNMGTKQSFEDVVVMAFQARDIRGGKGERHIFRHMMSELLTSHPDLVPTLLDLIPEYGYWKDFFHIVLQDPRLFQPAFAICKKQLLADELALKEGRAVSLFARWMPKEGKKYGIFPKNFANFIYGGMEPPLTYSQGMAALRRRIVALNAATKTVETLECANRWDEIDPKMVPAIARKKARAAFMNEVIKKKEERGPAKLRHPDDPKRMACREHFQAFFTKAAKGEVKISGAHTLYPHDVVERMFSVESTDIDQINELNAVWAAMEKAAPGLDKCVFMGDFSGSMQSSGENLATPYWVSMAMCILGSSVAKPPFKNKFMTFDSNPRWHTFSPEDTTLQQKVNSIKNNRGIGQGFSTNFQAAGALLIADLVAAEVQPGDEPADLVVVTDMGFDAACGGNEYKYNSKSTPFQTHVEMLHTNFRNAGWKAPRITVWNVASSYSDNFQAAATTEGALLLSGWSPSLFKILCEGGPQPQNPYEGLRAQLDDPRYDPVRERVREFLQRAT